jgi:predicted nucleic-acid-binding Zn-ribbon protein
MKTTNLFFCPKCGSQNVGAVYSVSVGKVSIPPSPPKDRCLDCRYKELRGYFELINRREKKIDSILDDIKI